MAVFYYWSWRKAVDDLDALMVAIHKVANGDAEIIRKDGQVQIKETNT